MRVVPGLEVAGLDDSPGHFMAIIEHANQFPFEESFAKLPPEPPEGWFVVDLVPEDRPPLTVVEEEVAVFPACKRAVNLAVGEEAAGLVLGMLGDPAQREGPERDLQDDSTTRPERISPIDQLHLVLRRRET